MSRTITRIAVGLAGRRRVHSRARRERAILNITAEHRTAAEAGEVSGRWTAQLRSVRHSVPQTCCLDEIVSV